MRLNVSRGDTMLFNKNIILDILRRNFSFEIENFIEVCVSRFDEFELECIFDEEIDFALLNNIDEMTVEDFAVENDENAQYVDGVFEISIFIDGYRTEELENYYVASIETVIGIGFAFNVEDDCYSDIDLEYLY